MRSYYLKIAQVLRTKAWTWSFFHSSRKFVCVLSGNCRRNHEGWISKCHNSHNFNPGARNWHRSIGTSFSNWRSVDGFFFFAEDGSNRKERYSAWNVVCNAWATSWSESNAAFDNSVETSARNFAGSVVSGREMGRTSSFGALFIQFVVSSNYECIGVRRWYVSSKISWTSPFPTLCPQSFFGWL